jgi:hypothetical protein
MKLVILNHGPDTAGVGFNLKQAFDRYAPDWTARSVSRGVTYLDYPLDILWWAGKRGLRMERTVTKLVAQADVLHVMDGWPILELFKDVLGHQKIIVQHLGTYYRRDRLRAHRRCTAWGATQVTDSIDLVSPFVQFLPTAIDTDALAALRQPNTSSRIRIAHAPTDRTTKSTEAIIEAVMQLGEKYPITFDLIEGVTNAECLQRKARADIFVDQTMLGWGVNNIECWSMGIPVVSGIEDHRAKKRAMRMFGGQLPWADATEATLHSVIEHLILNPDWRAALGERGRQHAQRWHSQEAVVEQTLKVYQRAGVRLAA